jgi:hypothetical protein
MGFSPSQQFSGRVPPLAINATQLKRIGFHSTCFLAGWRPLHTKIGIITSKEWRRTESVLRPMIEMVFLQSHYKYSSSLGSILPEKTGY